MIDAQFKQLVELRKENEASLTILDSRCSPYHLYVLASAEDKYYHFVYYLYNGAWELTSKKVGTLEQLFWFVYYKLYGKV